MIRNNITKATNAPPAGKRYILLLLIFSLGDLKIAKPTSTIAATKNATPPKIVRPIKSKIEMAKVTPFLSGDLMLTINEVLTPKPTSKEVARLVVAPERRKPLWLSRLKKGIVSPK